MKRVLFAALLLTGVVYAQNLSVDAIASGDNSGASVSISTISLSTTAGNELLLAFVSADGIQTPNTTVTSVSGGGLTWELVQRANSQLGTAEIWRAFSPQVLSGVTITANLSQKVVSSLTVITFAGVDTSGVNGSGAIGTSVAAGAPSGGPALSLTTSRNGSLVLGVGNDWDNAINRTAGPNQTIV